MTNDEKIEKLLDECIDRAIQKIEPELNVMIDQMLNEPTTCGSQLANALGIIEIIEKS